MQNIEFKCELRDLVAARAQCRILGADRIGRMTQLDTYYRLPAGRLKKREVDGEPIEWIFYHRSDRLTPKMSHFKIYSEEQARLRWGLVSLRQWLCIRKRREVYLKENVRIHLDEVDRLGTFIEFEALVSPKFNVRICHEQIGRLRAEFAPVLGEVISGSYADLLDSLLRENVDAP